MNSNYVAHAFANKIQSRASNGSSFYFKGDTIYSFGSHFPISVHYKDVVLMTTRTYSNSTAKHIGKVHSATSHLKKIYCKHPTQAAKENHTENIQDWVDRINWIKENNLGRANKPAIYLDQIQREINYLNEYVEFFGIELDYSVRELITNVITPEFLEKVKLQAKRDTENKRKQLKNGREVAEEWKTWWRNNQTLTDFFDINSYSRHNMNLYLKSVDSNLVWLRLIDSEIETTKGIKLPVNVAKHYYKWYLNILSKGGCNSSCNYKILDFKVISANEKELIVGCHKILREEIDYIANLLKWSIN